MRSFVCKVCGFVAINGSAPEKCPVCGSPKTAFMEKEEAVKTIRDANNPTDLEKKHVPIIAIEKKCNLITGTCLDVHAKIGRVEHPMFGEHYIQHIDFYLDKKFVARVMLTPSVLNPAAAVHLKAEKGRVSVVEQCNLHGCWMEEADL